VETVPLFEHWDMPPFFDIYYILGILHNSTKPEATPEKFNKKSRKINYFGTLATIYNLSERRGDINIAGKY